MTERIYSIKEIQDIVTPIAIQHGVERVYLFGSYARGEATESSDIDLCIDADSMKGLFALGGLYADLEDALEKELDLVTTASLHYNSDSHFLDNMRKDQVLLYGAA